jgi:phospho-N-acetylmuramoyl-pentapeptide-transferase
MLARWLAGLGLEALPEILLRAGLAAATALVASLILGRFFIRFQLRRRILERADKTDSARLAELHRSKTRTPTMGGVFFLGGMLLAWALWCDLRSPFVWGLAAAAAGLGALGFADDLIKLHCPGRKGLSARTKLRVQIALGLGLGLLHFLLPAGGGSAMPPGLRLPLLGLTLPLGLGFIAWCALAVTASSNAVNLTDGIDGLAMGCAALAAVPLAALAALSGIAGGGAAAGEGLVAAIPGAEEVAVALAALVGSGLGFLWYNCHPARVFMGDTGALPLGGVLGLSAVLIRQEILFAIAGGVFLVEALSVMLQVGSFKLRGKRIFLIAPLHHHFQFRGWRETRVTAAFWCAAAILAALSLTAVSMARRS